MTEKERLGPLRMLVIHLPSPTTTRGKKKHSCGNKRLTDAPSTPPRRPFSPSPLNPKTPQDIPTKPRASFFSLAGPLGRRPRACEMRGPSTKVNVLCVFIVSFFLGVSHLGSAWTTPGRPRKSQRDRKRSVNDLTRNPDELPGSPNVSP